MSVKLDKFLDIALEIREMELQMMLHTKFREIDKIGSIMKREIEKIIANSKEKLEEELKLYKKAQVHIKISCIHHSHLTFTPCNLKSKEKLWVSSS